MDLHIYYVSVYFLGRGEVIVIFLYISSHSARPGQKGVKCIQVMTSNKNTYSTLSKLSCSSSLYLCSLASKASDSDSKTSHESEFSIHWWKQWDLGDSSLSHCVIDKQRTDRDASQIKKSRKTFTTITGWPDDNGQVFKVPNFTGKGDIESFIQQF